MCAVHVGEADEAMQVAANLAGLGVLAPAIRPPTVPAGTCRIRLAPHARLEAAQVSEVVDKVLQAIGKS